MRQYVSLVVREGLPWAATTFGGIGTVLGLSVLGTLTTLVSRDVFLGLAVGFLSLLLIFVVGAERIWVTQQGQMIYLEEVAAKRPVSPVGVPYWDVTCDNMVDRAAFDLSGPGVPGMEVRCDIEDTSGKLHFATKTSPDGKLIRFTFPTDFAAATTLEKGSYRLRWIIRFPSTESPFDAAEGTFEIGEGPRWKL